MDETLEDIIAEARGSQKTETLDDVLMEGRARELSRLAGADAGQRAVPGHTQTEDPDVWDWLAGGADGALTALTGMVAEVSSGVRGLGQAVYQNLAEGAYTPLSETVQRIEETAEMMTWMPKTDEGQRILQAVGAAPQWIEEKAKKFGEAVTKATGSPAAGTAAYMSPETIAGVVAAPIFRPLARLRGRKEDINLSYKMADDLGIDLDRSLGIQQQQIKTTISDIVGDMEAGGSMERVSLSVEEKRKLSQNMVNAEFRLARAGRPSGLTKENINAVFAPVVSEAFDHIDLRDPEFKPLEASIKELEQLATSSPGVGVPFGEMERWLQRTRNKIRRIGSGRNREALIDLERMYREFRDSQLNAGLLMGDPATIAQWKRALNRKALHDSEFGGKTIQQLADSARSRLSYFREQGVTVEEMRNWVFGANEVGFRAGAATTVRELKNILGPNSPEFRALQRDALLNIVEPLLTDIPDVGPWPGLTEFRSNYTKATRKSNSAVKELFDTEQLSNMNRLAAALEKHGKAGVDMPDPDAIVVRMLWGNQLAKNHAFMRVMTSAIKGARKVVHRKARRKIISELVGYDSGASVFPSSAVPITAGTLSSMKSEEEQ